MRRSPCDMRVQDVLCALSPHWGAPYGALLRAGVIRLTRPPLMSLINKTLCRQGLCAISIVLTVTQSATVLSYRAESALSRPIKMVCVCVHRTHTRRRNPSCPTHSDVNTNNGTQNKLNNQLHVCSHDQLAKTIVCYGKNRTLSLEHV